MEASLVSQENLSSRLPPLRLFQSRCSSLGAPVCTETLLSTADTAEQGAASCNTPTNATSQHRSDQQTRQNSTVPPHCLFFFCTPEACCSDFSSSGRNRHTQNHRRDKQVAPPPSTTISLTSSRVLSSVHVLVLLAALLFYRAYFTPSTQKQGTMSVSPEQPGTECCSRGTESVRPKRMLCTLYSLLSILPRDVRYRRIRLMDWCRDLPTLGHPSNELQTSPLSLAPLWRALSFERAGSLLTLGARALTT